MAPSSVIRKSIDNTGSPHEMDSFLTQYEGSVKYGEIVEEIYRITMKHSNDQYPIGYSNPDSYDELLLYAQQLSDSGM